MISPEKEEQLIEYYERKIRRGFPSGEVKSELLKHGYSETEAGQMLAKLDQLSIKKGKEREEKFRYTYSVILVFAGAILYLITGRAGLWLIASGVMRFIYEVFINKSDKEEYPIDSLGNP